MTNSISKHSKKLRQKTAAAYNKKQRAAGNLVGFSLYSKPDIVVRIKTLTKEIQAENKINSQAATLLHILEFYKQHNSKQ